MKTLQGTAQRIAAPLLGRATRKKPRFAARGQAILVSETAPASSLGAAAVVTAAPADACRLPGVFSLACEQVAAIQEGDVLLLDGSGAVRCLWEVNSRSNVLMVTNVCNCRCIMCPQPSRRDPEDQLAFNRSILELVDECTVEQIGLTGGEPTLRLDDLCALLALCKQRFPNAAISLLTNGRAFHDFEAVCRVASVRHPRLLHCVSLQGDTDAIHDRLMGARGSFRETVQGLHNLARLGQRVEIRVVLTRNNVARVPSLAEFIYRNFPFVSHVALMGMETTGLAWQNLERLWVEPTAYVPQLRRAVQHLHRRALRVSIYNLPLCLLPHELWPFACDSISEWKKTYLPECQTCSVRERCPGVFATSEKQPSGIHPPHPLRNSSSS